MNLICSDWSEQHIQMGKKIRNPQYFEQMRKVLLELHGMVHRASVSGVGTANPVDSFFSSLSAEDFAAVPSAKSTSIAWCIWHIARIEDATMNLLVKRGDQIFDSDWQRRTGSPVADTGNALTQEEIRSFSAAVRAGELLAYRDEVGKRSRSIVNSLSASDMKRKISCDDIERLHREGCLAEHPDSLWLLDFWGKKDVAGLLLMPLTRHQTMHLNDCERYAAVLAKKQKGIAHT